MAFATVATLATAVTATVAIATGTAAFAARTAGGLVLDIAFGLRKQRLAAELDFATLVVESDDLHLELVALLDETFQRGGMGPLLLADVHHAFLAGQELHEGTKLDNRDNLGIIHVAHLGNGADVLNPLESSSDIVLVL